ncbi:TPA: TrkH family potassium uptake protein [Staphylococcus aureus]|nr:TrkH family potassium uptake protein [Staphylococcus aureus]HDE4844178.1 TrkH family potassium uptake protein [Staphylococcus aureus]HDF0952348.1 TrkH family potassium uptake protein [Staphylococcus aureus]HDF4313016.1 TrkH family potassium uptake protein [Staphylococcus aureus]HDG1184118.1 TrkH family potassium uptake protein [Staphylococcus aureus]
MNKVHKPLYFYLMLFFSTTIIGALLLSLPFTGKKPISFLDALFIASSAFTVTGLSPVDIGSQFNILGEIVILLLIQIGGLGIVTVTLLTLVFLNRKISMKNRFLIMVTWNIDEPGGVIKLIKHLAIYSLVTELIGMICLCLSFIPKFGIGKGLFLSLFTSVSAFNNAGFALFKNNLIDYSNDPIVIITISILIIFGGIGHFVVIDFINCKKLSKLSLHSKLVLTTTSILIIIGAITFFLLEQFNTMQNMGLVEKIGNSFFQSVTTRTAGFNSIDIASINKSTALMLMLLMFIGGAPLSAAGGIKITTFAVAFIFVLNYIRKENNVFVFNKEISNKHIKLSIVTINISFLFISIITFILSIINPNISLIKLLFEVVSAFGTVGLSMNLTTEYHGITKIIIIFVMLCGKVGLLTLLRTFIPPKSPKNYRYTKGQIYL